MLRKLSTVTAAAALLAAVGFSGSAWAQTELLTNGDAEDEVIAPWVSTGLGDPAAVTDLDRIFVGPLNTYAFDMGNDTGLGGSGTATLAQEDLDVSECNLTINNVDLQGAWTLDGSYVTELVNGDFGTINIEFFDGGAGRRSSG